MTLMTAAVLLVLALAGLFATPRLLRKKKGLRIACTVLCALLVLACALYIALTLLFLDAARHK